MGAFTAAITFGISTAGNLTYGQQLFARAVSGGVIESLQGGNFGSGFVAAGLTAMFMPQLGGIDNNVVRTAVGALIGGTISVATGGKFANGAISGAIQGAMSKDPSSSPRDDGERRLPERTDSLEIKRVAEAATAEANEALKPTKGVVYPTRRAAARAWNRYVRPVADKHGTEIASRFFYRGKGFEIGTATSEGFRYTVNPNFSYAASGSAISAGYIHTHPTTNLFSKNDLTYALDMYRDVNGWVHGGQFDQVAMVSLANGKIYAWSALQYMSSNGASYMNKDYYHEY